MSVQSSPSTFSRTSPASSTSTVSLLAKSNQKSCRVVGCPTSNCRLPVLRQRDGKLRHPTRCNDQTNITTPTTNTNLAKKHEDLSIRRKGVDGFPSLPIKESLDPELRTLFHHFFDSNFARLAIIFRGLSEAMILESKQRMLDVALNSESYCMGLIVLARTEISIARGALPETRQTLSVYTKGVEAFRKQVMLVQQLPEPLQVELALLSLCTLAVYDTFHERDSALQMHWIGLRQLVALRGGISTLTVSLPYVVHVDRMCAQRLNQEPMFAYALPRQVLLPSPLWSSYGSKLANVNRDRFPAIASTIVNYCVDTCSLLEMWEVSNGGQCMSPSAKTPQQPPTLEYLYCTRDRIDECFASFHAQVWDHKGRDKYLLWTARILEYPYTWVNYIPTLNALLCTHLTTTLQDQDLRLWYDDMDMLTWILFALAVVSNKPRTLDWVTRQLQRTLYEKLKCVHWPADWRERELENVRSFVWCDTMYTDKFHEVCDELELRVHKKADPDGQIQGLYPAVNLLAACRKEVGQSIPQETT